MKNATNEDYDRLAKTNEDRFEQIEIELNRTLELLDAGDTEKARERADTAAHMAGQGVRLNIVATQ